MSVFIYDLPHGANTGGQQVYLVTQGHSWVYRCVDTQEDYTKTETSKISASHAHTPDTLTHTHTHTHTLKKEDRH